MDYYPPTTEVAINGLICEYYFIIAPKLMVYIHAEESSFEIFLEPSNLLLQMDFMCSHLTVSAATCHFSGKIIP